MSVRTVLPAGATVSPDRHCVEDLRLDRVADALAALDPRRSLRPMLGAAPTDPEVVAARQEVFADLADPDVFAAVESFTRSMNVVIRLFRIARETAQEASGHRRHLDAFVAYAVAVRGLHEGLSRATLHSAALTGLVTDLKRYLCSREFVDRQEEAMGLLGRLDRVRYDLLIDGAAIRVAQARPGADFGAKVRETFARFGTTAEVRDYRRRDDSAAMDAVEARVLDLVTELFPDLFSDLAAFCRRHADPIRPELRRLDEELGFCVAWLRLLAPLREAGLPICLPRLISTTPSGRTTPAGDWLRAEQIFDLALALELVPRGGQVVTNDLELTGPERMFVVSGANQGGKTTLARALGQLHYLASLGLPVPGRSVQLQVPDKVLTHFPRKEAPESGTGRLVEELHRLAGLLEQATPRSVLLLNEIFASTTEDDAIELSLRIRRRLLELGATVLWVSFVPHLAAEDHRVVSLVAEVTADHAATRTHRVVRRAPDGQSYAQVLAAKHGLRGDQIRRRLTRCDRD